MCTDGSKFAEEAIDIAGYLLKFHKPEVTVLRVVPDLGQEKSFSCFSAISSAKASKVL